MENNTQELKKHLIEGEYRRALKLAKNFRMGFTKEEKGIISRAYEMYNNNTFYSQLGYNADKELNKALDILNEKYLQEVE